MSILGQPPSDKTSDKELSSTEERIFGLLAMTPEITQKKMAERLGLSTGEIRYQTDKLQSKGLLKRVGGKEKWSLGNLH